MSEGVRAGGRRLPIYLLLDCSSSMAGQPIEAVRRGIRSLISDLRQDPQALETAWVSVITFGAKTEQIVPLTELSAFEEPPLRASGVAVPGEALQLLIQCIGREVRKSTAVQKGDWKPLIFIMTNCQPIDDWEQIAEELKRMKIGQIIVCTSNAQANDRVLECITEAAIRLDSLDSRPDALRAFFKWVSSSIKTTSACLDTLVGTEVPRLPMDQVQFSVTAPPVMIASGCYVVDVWIYLAEQREQIIERAKQEYDAKNIRIKSKSGVILSRGTSLTVRLNLPGFEVEDPEDVIVWEGEIGNATFPVSVPENTSPGPHPGWVLIYVNGLQIAKVHFVVDISPQPATVQEIADTAQKIRTAFASYASADRDDVLARVQGIQKALPDLDIFLDVVSLRSGQAWLRVIGEEIANRDIFYLFWSKAASESQHVEQEWKMALEKRGVEFISPVPLVDPQDVPPPSELASYLHFNDWVLAYIRSRRPHHQEISLPPPPPGIQIVP